MKRPSRRYIIEVLADLLDILDARDIGHTACRDCKVGACAVEDARKIVEAYQKENVA